MGCHTWFKRPIAPEEFQMMKDYAPICIYNLVGDSEKNIRNGTYDKALYEFLMKSYNENLPCVYGYYWWQLGYGGDNPKFLNGEANVSLIYGKLYVEVPEYWDTFRVLHYPRKVIGSRKELRRWMGKKYFELSDDQLSKISQFFRENLGGVITFG